MVDKVDYERFQNLRRKVMDGIAKALKEDGYCKSYEGAFEVTTCFPNYFDDETATSGAEFYAITLHCYVIGPSRHYEWNGKTFAQALDKAELEIESWLEESNDGNQENL